MCKLLYDWRHISLLHGSPKNPNSGADGGTMHLHIVVWLGLVWSLVGFRLTFWQRT